VYRGLLQPKYPTLFDLTYDDSSGLCYYGDRYLAPWLTRWISPDSAGAVHY
jgi:RHS repeat-associated protein